MVEKEKRVEVRGIALLLYFGRYATSRPGSKYNRRSYPTCALFLSLCLDDRSLEDRRFGGRCEVPSPRFEPREASSVPGGG